MVYSITTVPSGKVHEALGISTERADHFIDAITTKLDELSEKKLMIHLELLTLQSS